MKEFQREFLSKNEVKLSAYLIFAPPLRLDKTPSSHQEAKIGDDLKYFQMKGALMCFMM